MYQVGDLVGEKQCLEYTFEFVAYESLYRSKDNIHYKPFSTISKSSSDILKVAMALVESRDVLFIFV